MGGVLEPGASQWAFEAGMGETATMTVATNAILTAVIGATSLLDFGVEDHGLPANELVAPAEQSLRHHAPATWLDAVSVDERCKAGQVLPARMPSPCDDVGLYPRFLSLAD